MSKLDLKDGLAARMGKTVDDSGMSTKEAAKMCGVGAATMAAYLNSNSPNLPTMETFVRFCEVFEASADWLLFGKEAE